MLMSPFPGLAGKSAAAAIEARAIREMRDAGFPLISDHDARTKRTPEQRLKQAVAA
ncbi:MAG: hypothetical protein IVW55_17100 [Chloroflexi bacterium]|nr:hypothetical protein [Chloroflexota bacterium]